MRKKCEKCSREFEARQSYFKLCPDCFSSSQHRTRDISELLLKSYYDQENNLVKEVFISVSEELAKIFYRDELAHKQLYDFKKKILKARNIARLKGIEKARPILLKCIPEGECQFKRGYIPRSFKEFLEYHIPIAEKDTKALEGFYEHFESIYMYFPIKSERRSR